MCPPPIPPWDADGRLPPTSDAVGVDRSPYRASLLDLVLRFGTTHERREILFGFFDYRKALAAAGITRGFQWVNGSFSEQVEIIRNRPPNDVDVVTFFHLPENMTEEALFAGHAELFDHDRIKHQYKVDGYPLGLYEPPEYLVRQTSYWYSMWAHRRGDELWKGFVQVDLDTSDDDEAIRQLESMEFNADIE